MADIDLSARFPDMQPIKSAPTLSTINGIGTTVYGSRDHDPHTGTFVTTQCFTVLYIPVLMLRAFRVAKAQGGGWYFLGREPLSFVARLWNLLVVGGGVSAAGLIVLSTYFNSPEYKAQRKLAQARATAVENPAQAARDYREVIQGKTKYAAEASQELQKLVHATMETGTLEQCGDVLTVAVNLLQAKQGGFQPQSLVDDAVQAAKRFEAEDPRAVLALVTKAAEVAPKPQSLIALRQALLEKVVRQQPDNVESASALAVIYESQERPQLCRKLLEPLAGKLGNSEGARVLGQIYAASDTPEKSLALLTPYATERLKKLHEAEKNLEDTYKARFEQTIKQMENGQAPGFSMTRYERAGEVERQAMVTEYVAGRLKDDPDLSRAQEQIVAHGAVVPVALDIGVVLLHRGQRQTDEAARKRDLQQAEEMFLAVRGQAGENDMFRLYLGQVYYWLGKHAEGHKVFDELLAAHNRQGDLALAVASTLRDVGVSSEARTLAEELYQKETDKEKKYKAARMVAATGLETDEEIKWLKRCDPKDQDAKASIQRLLGTKALDAGRDDAALAHFRSATEIYNTMPQSTSVLNNSALVWLTLADVTGDPDDFKQAAVRMEKASTMSRADSILLLNTASTLTTAALGDAVRDTIDLRTLKSTGSFDLLPYLYRDAAGRQKVVNGLKQSADMKRALEYFERTMLLAPRSPQGYTMACRFYDFTRDKEAMATLKKRMASVTLDLEDQRKLALKHFRGERDAELLKTYQKSIDRSRKTLVAARAKGGITRAVAAGQLAELLEEGAEVGMAINADELVALAEEAVQAAPSLGSNGDLRGALLFRAAANLARSDARLAAMLKRTKRTLNPGDVLAVALEKPGPLRDKVLANADVRRVQQSILETRKNFPDESTSWQWAFLQASHPDVARQIAGELRANELSTLETEIIAQMTALSPTAAMHARWKAIALGDEAAADAPLAPCRAAGLPLPWGK